MKRIKDFLYNWNDIIIVLCIVILAALVIYWRVNVIMNYPLTLATETTRTSQADGDADKDGAGKDSSTSIVPGNSSSGGESSPPSDGSSPVGSDNGSATGKSPADGAVWKDGVLRSNMEVTVESSGTASGAVQSLVEAGLFESFDEFASIASERGYDPSYIVAGIYTFSAGSSQDDIVDVVMTGGIR